MTTDDYIRQAFGSGYTEQALGAFAERKRIVAYMRKQAAEIGGWSGSYLAEIANEIAAGEHEAGS